MANGIKKDILSSHHMSLDEVCGILQYDVMVDIISNKLGITHSEVITANSWYDLGFDDLDGVEFIMEIEKKYSCHIDDISAWQILDMSPKRLCQMLLVNKRDQQIDQIVQ